MCPNLYFFFVASQVMRGVGLNIGLNSRFLQDLESHRRFILNLPRVEFEPSFGEMAARDQNSEFSYPLSPKSKEGYMCL